ncbi:poly-glutamine tract binding protein 1 isoform X2 [Rhynchophorus ferrugineus]|uniref:poly-glutamine tract binding protein 1 isoform X2 n=1 Tax=Rhynchophorus ferrugineus TaxID=354439 RepID=UPI003FCD1DB4
MPLPPALAAKLTKRGIIAPKQKPLDTLKKIDYKGLSTCPNKNNIYHECTHWCETHWKGILTPESKYMRNMQKVLVKYPLPNNWTEVFDKGIGRYYYWNMETDMVSWLPPKHPKAVLTKSASKLRERRVLDNKEDKTKDDSRKEKDGDRNSDKERDKDSDDDDRSYRSKHSDRSARERGDRERDRDKDRDDRRKRDRDDRYRREKEKRQKKDDQLDPMDPAAYSDIPQGTWSDGLETNKIRADNTASGVLFQQRPYPAPGAVLAANKEKERRK